MSSIYRRARPATFDQVIGQDHVKSVLTAAITRGAVGHAYLFSGPRGVGKTTTARLLAMAVNCEREPAEAPCGECESCRLIRTGSHPDVTELDAASNNSVEDIRELREQVRLASLRGGTRVWILDEAHMLSRSAANALLKTLEEPPPSLVFVLATTEPEKLLPTILSRCQHFRFRRLAEHEIAGKLERLCAEANVTAAAAALELVARAADGAMRDAESMLERLLASGTEIGRKDAEDALGLPPQDRLDGLATALAEGDVAGMLETAGALYRDGFAPRSLAEQLARTLRDALYRSVTGGDGFTLPLERDDQLRLLHALDDEQERFIRHDDLFALEAALVKAHNALFRNVPADAVATTAAPRAPTGPRVPTQAVGASAPVPSRSAAARDDADLPAFDPHARSKREPAAPPPEGAREHAASRAGVTDASERSSSAPPAGHAPPSEPRPTEPSRSQPPPRQPSSSEQPPSEQPPSEQPPSATPPSPAPAAPGPASAAPARSLDWREVKARASAQLKAFLMPAQEDVGDGRIVLRYGDTHRFHFQELKKRDEELAALVADVGGAGYTIVVEGPGDTLRKKS